jgi:hypothetical protein
MYKEFYAGHALLGWPIFALLFFVAVFTWVVVREARRGSARHAALEALPLSDDDRSRAIPGGDANQGVK